eukprot:GHVO01046835.1.p1 GENE.GHVO01046835.1~~GHVO01046835.1.p1  ORF type:complete len:241 (+),score=33.56 GHVO01046835.1:86-808(+)
MPRRRKTVKTSRPLKVNQDVDLGDVEEDVRKEKLRVLISDFDKEVERRLARYDEMEQQVLRKIDAAYRMELCKIPKHIRTMKVTDFLAAGGTFDAVAMKNAEELVASLTSGPSGSQLGDIEEENNDPTAKKTTRAKAAGGKRRRAVAPPSTTRGLRSLKMQTPANGPLAKATWATPMVTPKFNPNLPRTPENTRNPLPGEKIVMSLNGSPINSQHAEVQQLERKVAELEKHIAQITVLPE